MPNFKILYLPKENIWNNKIPESRKLVFCKKEKQYENEYTCLL